MAKSKFYELIKNARIEKDVIVILFIILSNIVASAQISIYTSDDNVESVVYDVEDLYPEEIKVYNQWRKEGDSHEEAMRLINYGRAQNNLIAAPATIIEYGFDIDKNSSDGEIILFGFIINSSPKTIKEITLQFEFEGSYGQVYDIKTGDKYMIIKLTDLTGRTKSNLYCDIDRHLLETFHGFKSTEKPQKKPSRQCDVISIKPFHNRKAEKIRLHSVKIKYVDGSTSTKIAVFDSGYSNDKRLYMDGPLAPISKYVHHIYQLKQDKTHIVKEGQTLTRIASIYNVSKDAIMKANNLTNEHIFIGQTLKIPTSEIVAIPPKPKQSEPNYPIDKPEVSGLDGYTLTYFPKDKSTVVGTVVVRVVVSPTGDVKAATVVGGSVTDEMTRTLCLGLAQQTTFRVPMGQVIERTGTLTYTIKEGLTPSTKTEKDEVFTSAAHMPSFPGGDGALMKYIWSHLRYPESAAANNVNGKVIVQFVVEKDGSVGEVKVARSVDKELDAEAIRVCKTLPKFSPGRNANGDAVNVWYTLPITFKLQGTE